MSKPGDLRNIDSVIIAVAQLLQPSPVADVVAEARVIMGKSPMTKQQISSRIKSLETDGFLWLGTDKRILVTPKGNVFSQASIPPKDRDKFRLLFLNKMHYK